MWSQPFTAAALALCLLPSALGSTRAGLRAHKPAAKRQARELALLEKRADPTNGTDSSDPTGSMPGGNSSTSMRYMSNMTSRMSPLTLSINPPPTLYLEDGGIVLKTP